MWVFEVKCPLVHVSLREVLLVKAQLSLRWASSITRTTWGTCGPSKRRLISFDRSTRWLERQRLDPLELFFFLLPFHWLRQVVFQVTFTEEELPKGSGDFILGYYSNNMSTIVGVTEPFQVIILRLCAVIASFTQLFMAALLHSLDPASYRGSWPQLFRQFRLQLRGWQHRRPGEEWLPESQPTQEQTPKPPQPQRLQQPRAGQGQSTRWASRWWFSSWCATGGVY